jgi:hypothetical protein
MTNNELGSYILFVEISQQYMGLKEKEEPCEQI